MDIPENHRKEIEEAIDRIMQGIADGSFITLPQTCEKCGFQWSTILNSAEAEPMMECPRCERDRILDDIEPE
jgi:predicted Zn-ribbon and HTH transcriptional regulator